MSRPRGGNLPPALPASQRDASPPPALPLCTPRVSHSMPSRVFGSEITNRISTSSPPQTSFSLTAAGPSSETTATRCGVAADVLPPCDATLAPTPSLSGLEADPCRHSSPQDDMDCISSYETLLGAISVSRIQKPPLLEGACSCSCSSGSGDASPNHLFPSRTAGVRGQQLCLEPTRGGTSFQTEASIPAAPKTKRRFRDGEDSRTVPCSSWPQAKRQRGEEAAVGCLTRALPAFPMQERGVCEPSGTDNVGGGSGGVDVRPSLTLSSEDDRDPWSACRGVGGFLTPLSTKLLCLPPVALLPLPPSQHLQVHACRPASLLDREHPVPAWQVLTLAPTMTEEEEREGLGHAASTSTTMTLCTPARSHASLRNAVDDAMVYSLQTLDDISPILCLSEEMLEHRRMHAAEHDRRASAEVNEEEQRADRTFSATSPFPTHHLFCAPKPAEGCVDEEDMRRLATDLPTPCFAGSAHFLHEEALQLLTVTCEAEHGSRLE